MEGKLCVVLLLLVAAVAAQAPCSFTDPDTQDFYDLSKLRLLPSAEVDDFYSYIDDTVGQIYLNICAAVNTAALNCTDNSAMCEATPDNNVFSGGLAEGFQLSAYPGGVSLVYQGGDPCNYAPDRSTTVQIACVPDADLAAIQNVTETDCAYTIQMISSAACSVNSTMEDPTPTVTATPSVSASPSASVSLSPSVSVSVSQSLSMSQSVGQSVAVTASSSASPSVSVSLSVSISAGESVAPGETANATQSMSVSVMPTMSTSVVVGPTVDAPEATEPGTWIWYVMISTVIFVLCMAGAIAGLVILQKKRQDDTFESLDFE